MFLWVKGKKRFVRLALLFLAFLFVCAGIGSGYAIASSLESAKYRQCQQDKEEVIFSCANVITEMIILQVQCSMEVRSCMEYTEYYHDCCKDGAWFGGRYKTPEDLYKEKHLHKEKKKKNE